MKVYFLLISAISFIFSGCASKPNVDFSNADSGCSQKCTTEYSNCMSGFKLFPLLAADACNNSIEVCAQACPKKTLQ